MVLKQGTQTKNQNNQQQSEFSVHFCTEKNKQTILLFYTNNIVSTLSSQHNFTFKNTCKNKSAKKFSVIKCAFSQTHYITH